MATGLTKQQRAKLDTQIDKWQQDLVNLTKRNKLLHFKHTKTSSLELTEPALAVITAGLDRGPLHFADLPTENPDDPIPPLRANQVRTNKRLAKEQLNTLKSLERVSQQTLLDTGLSTLYIGYGMLQWRDPAEKETTESPLILQPVSLSRQGSTTQFELKRTDDDPVLNPALAIKLATDFDIELPTIDELDASPSKALDELRTALLGQPEWTIRDRAVLTTFTFHKEAMYRDLLTNTDLITEHPLVQLAAVGPSAGSTEFAFDPLRDDALDSVAPPEQLVSVRDADSTQRKCIIAARDGRSFVMNGPPGTGKSQTITNIIAELLHAGKSVLFVSEKMAALDVVANRLRDAGLGDFILSLHSHKATRKEVALELDAAARMAPRATSKFSETDRSSLLKLRQNLNDYAIASNEVRSPLGQSLHQVIGRVVELQAVPQAPVAGAIDSDLQPDELANILDAAERLGRSWKPVEEGDAFLWRALRDASTSVSRQEEIRRQLANCTNLLDEVRSTLTRLDGVVGLGWTASIGDAQRLQQTLTAIATHSSKHPLPAAWLTPQVLSDARLTLTARRATIEQLRFAEAEALTDGGPHWANLPAGMSESLAENLRIVNGDPIGWQLNESSTLELPAEVVRLAEEVLPRAEVMTSSARKIAAAFGISVGRLTIGRMADLAELTTYMDSATPPEPTWLSPFGQAALQEAATVLTELVSDYRTRRTALDSTFTSDVLDLDLPALKARITAASALGKLGGSYRADKKLLASKVISGKVDKAVLARLDEAIALAHLSNRLRAAEASHSEILGRYYRGVVDTDLDRLERALRIARRAVEVAGPATSGLTNQIGAGGSRSHEIVEAGTVLGSTLHEWTTIVRPRLEALGLSDSYAIDEIGGWFSRTHASFAVVAASLEAANTSVRQSLTIAKASRLLDCADRIAALHTALGDHLESDRAIFGEVWAGATTDLLELHNQLASAEGIVELLGGPVSSGVADALCSLDPSSQILAARLDSIDAAWRSITDFFDADHASQLTADFSVSFDEGAAMLAELSDSVSDIEVWSRFRAARADLHSFGLEPVVTFLERERIPADRVAGVIERAVLERWADVILGSDSRLSTVAPTERNSLVERFRELDRALVANSAASVINACSDRRPTSMIGAMGIILREAQKKTRHIPIRDLVQSTSEVVTLLKPCFMMSPLSVSQYLPPETMFDVVIFDEASQVKPADAINCIYRGTQLIVAGDPRQLPPTSFFEQVTEDSGENYDETAPEDFESVLDIFIGSGLPQLSLDWHYRSQHEALITYSNYRFYDGRLHTFPGAVEEADDVGVALIPADGVYRRGAARDNPIEAQKVVERVLFHRRKHPHLTIGVVAFSTAQESTIAAEFDRQRSTVPEIAELMGVSDRLDGFFVKNLENVQGDERDIIIFSIGYGPDENGKFTEQLGPLGQRGGERRLNVAITRARRRVEVVASISSGDFPGTSSAPGVRHLQQYLDFAERGPTALALDPSGSGHDTESVFEEQVVRVIQELGFTAVPQVGVAGYRIDIGIRNPARPGEYILGIECDGAAYHSSRVARDRDRLRQEILEGLGWKLYRIWGPSWFHDRAAQVEDLRTALTAALTPTKKRQPSPKVEPSRPAVAHEEVDLSAPPAWSVPYKVSSWTPDGWWNPQEVHALPASDFITGMVRILSIEGPMHEELLRKRLMEAYGVKRLGHRIKEAVDASMALAVRQRKLERIDRVFLQVPGTELRVRSASKDDDREKRPVAHVAPSERKLAIHMLVRDSLRVPRAELLVAFGRLFGWARIGDDIESAFARDLRELSNAGQIAYDSGDTIVVGRS